MQRVGQWWPRLQGLTVGYVGVSAYLIGEFSRLSYTNFTVAHKIPAKRALPFILGDTAAFIPAAIMWPRELPGAMREIYADVQLRPDASARRRYWTVHFFGGNVAREIGRVKLIRAGFIEGSCEYFEALADFCYEVELVGLDSAKVPVLRGGLFYP